MQLYMDMVPYMDTIAQDVMLTFFVNNFSYV